MEVRKFKIFGKTIVFDWNDYPQDCKHKHTERKNDGVWFCENCQTACIYINGKLEPLTFENSGL